VAANREVTRYSGGTSAEPSSLVLKNRKMYALWLERVPNPMPMP